jgi:hypothetical protein
LESILGPLGTATTTSLLYLPRVIVRMEKLAGENEVLGVNVLRHHFVHHKSHLPDQGANLGRRGGKPATNRLSYGAAFMRVTQLIATLFSICTAVTDDYLPNLALKIVTAVVLRLQSGSL